MRGKCKASPKVVNVVFSRPQEQIKVSLSPSSISTVIECFSPHFLWLVIHKIFLWLVIRKIFSPKLKAVHHHEAPFSFVEGRWKGDTLSVVLDNGRHFTLSEYQHEISWRKRIFSFFILDIRYQGFSTFVCCVHIFLNCSWLHRVRIRDPFCLAWSPFIINVLDH